MKPARLYPGLFLVSASAISFEVLLSRVFAVALWHHLTYMIVSVALLGYGAAGTLLSVKPGLLKREPAESMTAYSLLYILSLAAAYTVVNQIPFDPYQLLWSRTQILYLLVSYVLLAIPFFFSGLILATALSQQPKKSGGIYSMNLLGSSLGAVVPLLLLQYQSIPQAITTVIAVGFLGLLSFNLSGRRRRKIIVACGLLLILYSLLYPQTFEVRISPYKTLPRLLSYPNSKVVSTSWGLTSRVDVVESIGVRYAPGLSLTYLGGMPKQLGVVVDANYLGTITESPPPDFVDSLPASLPYAVTQRDSALVLGSGSEADLLSAVQNNVENILLVEDDTGVVEVRRAGLPSAVRLIDEDERSFLSATTDKFDVIAFSAREGVISGTSGVYSQTENYLYTVEAFQQYLNHLSGDGVLAVTRWLHHPPRESLRITALARQALEREGLNPREHIVVVRTLTTSTLLVKKTPYTTSDLNAVREFARERRFDLVYVPGLSPDEVNRFNRFPTPVYYEGVRMLIEDRGGGFARDYLFDLSPPTDGKPYFMNFLRWSKLRPLYESMGERWEPLFEGSFTVLLVFIQALVCSAALILYPIIKTKKRRAGSLPVLSYFTLIGLGFMFVEITLIQQFTLLLGQPTLSFAVVLAAMLFSSGLGSMASSRLSRRRVHTLMLLIPLLVFAYGLLLSDIIYIALGSTFGVRIIVGGLLVAPLGFLMGLPFPTGISALCGKNRALIPWAISVNGFFSVIGAVSAMMLLLTFGAKAVLFAAGVFYFGAAAEARSLRAL